MIAASISLLITILCENARVSKKQVLGSGLRIGLDSAGTDADSIRLVLGPVPKFRTWLGPVPDRENLELDPNPILGTQSKFKEF